MKRLFCVLIATIVVGVSVPASAMHWPTWDKILTKRFVRALGIGPGGTLAYLDKETGLVWEASPGTGDPTSNLTESWVSALYACNSRQVGNRQGWRLPTAQELASLVDPSVSSTPRLPALHPFTNVQAGVYWSSTTYEDPNTPRAWLVNFGGSVGNVVGVGIKSDAKYVWCVRGHQGVNPQ